MAEGNNGIIKAEIKASSEARHPFSPYSAYMRHVVQLSPLETISEPMDLEKQDILSVAEDAETQHADVHADIQ